MALQSIKSDQVISDGIVSCSRDEALKYQWNMIRNWKPESEIWPYTYGPGILSTSNVLSSLYIISYYRRKLQLQKYGKFIFYMPCLLIPVGLFPLAFTKFVSEPVLIQDECPVCIQVRSMFLHTTASVGYPVIAHSSLSIMMSYTYGLLRVQTKPLELFKYFLSITRPFGRALSWMCLVQSGLAFFITHRQAKTLFYIESKLDEEQERNQALAQ